MGKRRRERWLWFGLAVLQPVVVVALSYPQLSTEKVLLDCFVRLLLLGITVWIRRCLLPLFHSGSIRAVLILVCPLSLVALSVNAAQGLEESRVGLHILDAVLSGYIIALGLETLFAAVRWTACLGRGGGAWSVRMAERARSLRRAVCVLQKVSFSLTLLFLLALYALSRNYFFDWVVYSRICGFLLGTAFVLPLIIMHNKERKKIEGELALVEREMEYAANRVLQCQREEEGAGNLRYFRFWLDYRQALINSTRIPLFWQNWVVFLMLLLILLIEPYIFGAFAL